MRSNCGCGCNTGCNVDPCANCNTRCRTDITSADLTDDPKYFQVLDVNLCKKYTQLNLVDCAGEDIPLDTPLVTCADFTVTICDSLAALPSGGSAVPGTVLVGADCELYTLPALTANFTVLDTTTVNLTLAGSVLSADVIISPDAGNILEVHPNGLYASVCDGIDLLPVGAPVSGTGNFVGEDCQTHVFTESPLVAIDTSTVDFTTAAPNGHTLTAIVKISATPGNLITVNPDGLFLDCAQIEECLPAQPPITVIDTSTVDLTVSGINNHTLTAVVKLSGAIDNDLIINPDGLFFSLCNELDNLAGPVTPAVPGSTILVGNDCELYTIPGSNLAVLDTLTVDLTLTGSVLSADVEISAVAGNLITIRPDGLAVLAAASTVNVVAGDTNCIDVTVIESPNDNFTVSAAPIIAPTANNLLSCTPTGLYAAYPVLAPTFGISPAACNGLVLQPNGLAAPPDSAGSLGEMSLTNIAPVGPVTSGSSFTSGPLTLLIDNPSDCREAMLTISLYIPATIILEPVVPYIGTYLDLIFTHQFNLPTVLVTGPTIYSQFQVNGNNDTRAGSPPAIRTFNFIVPPSFSGSYTITTTATINNDCGGLFVGRVGSYYDLVTI